MSVTYLAQELLYRPSTSPKRAHRLCRTIQSALRSVYLVPRLLQCKNHYLESLFLTGSNRRSHSLRCDHLLVFRPICGFRPFVGYFHHLVQTFFWSVDRGLVISERRPIFGRDRATTIYWLHHSFCHALVSRPPLGLDHYLI